MSTVNLFAYDELQAQTCFKLFKGKEINFLPPHHYFDFLAENKCIFGNAISKFQSLVIFEK